MSAAQPRAGRDNAVAGTCAICGRTASDPRLLARCYGCQRPFHLNPYAAPGTDCGDVWTGTSGDDEFTGLELYCASCFGERSGEPREAAAPVASAPPPRADRPRWRRRYRLRRTGER